MSVELVSLNQVKIRLKHELDENERDVELQGAIYGASAMVLNYLKLGRDAYLSSDGEMEIDSDGAYVDVPPEVQEATILLVRLLTDGADSTEWQPGYLPAPVTAMLYPLRDPTIA